MTYKELLEELKNLNSEQLGQDVTLHLEVDDVFMPVQCLGVAVEDVLDAGHIVLVS
tara:strand:- start:95 stop:262 length:168 start_codon:yes stop_codon:yes gene_type:complete